MARLHEGLTARDELIVALQHVIRDLRHELENLRAAPRYAEFAREAPRSCRAQPEDGGAGDGFRNGLERGWRTGLEPATTGTTTRSSTN